MAEKAAVGPSSDPTSQTPAMKKASLYVGDLDPEVSETELIQVFSGVAMGSIASAKVCRDFNGNSLRYAYINFYSHSAAAKALACLNHTEVRGKPMRIMWTQRDPSTRTTGVANLFVKNLDPSVNSGRLHSIFCKFGTILSCKVAEENGRSKEFGFVQFDSEESAQAAIKVLHDTMLEGRKLYVSKFMKKSERRPAAKEPKFTNVYVKNLDEDLTEDLLRETFSKFGKTCSVVIMKNSDGKSRGFGFVNFESSEDAQKSVQAMNGSLLGSKHLYVGRAQKKAEREELLKNEFGKMHNYQSDKLMASNLYVRHLNSDIDDKTLQELFSPYGQVTSAKVMQNAYGASKGFGFVCFSSAEEAKKALEALHGTHFHGATLYVTHALPKKDWQKELEKYHVPQQNHVQSTNWDYPSADLHRPQQSYYTPLMSVNTVSHINAYKPIMCPYIIRQNDGVTFPCTLLDSLKGPRYNPPRQTQQGIGKDGVSGYSIYHGTSAPYWMLQHHVNYENYEMLRDHRSGSVQVDYKGHGPTGRSKKGLLDTNSIVTIKSPTKGSSASTFTSLISVAEKYYINRFLLIDALSSG
ncbi:RNA recognition motif domain [Dillenia turbinata]|uniref:RNA recognition motif domain n=1 Tax=Dillenia turbinata TaxID=194707 RepID=A0AAN8USG1_9MAGN